MNCWRVMETCGEAVSVVSEHPTKHDARRALRQALASAQPGCAYYLISDSEQPLPEPPDYSPPA